MASTQPKTGGKGCYKCGQTGHWSRDCTAQGSSYDPNRDGGYGGPSQAENAPQEPAPTVLKPSKKRPKLDPDLMLSEAGLGYILENFPKQVHFKGEGHEVGDLRRLLEAYLNWQQRLFSYLPFSQFVEKVEKVGHTKRIRLCMRELRRKVAKGGKAKASLLGGHGFNYGSDADEDGSPDNDAANDANLPPMPANDMPEDFFEETIRRAMGDDGAPQAPSMHTASAAENPTPVTITDEQKARMEDNRLRALARAEERKRMAATAAAAAEARLASSQAGAHASSAAPSTDSTAVGGKSADHMHATPMETATALPTSVDKMGSNPLTEDEVPVTGNQKETPVFRQSPAHGGLEAENADMEDTHERSVKVASFEEPVLEDEEASEVANAANADFVEKKDSDESLFDEEDYEPPLKIVRGRRRRVVMDDDDDDE